MPRVVAMDIETDSLDATCIWCICAEDVSTGEQAQFTYVDRIPEEKQRFIGSESTENSTQNLVGE